MKNSRKIFLVIVITLFVIGAVIGAYFLGKNDNTSNKPNTNIVNQDVNAQGNVIQKNEIITNAIKEENTIDKEIDETNRTNKTSQTALSEIKSCLKDENWIKKNILTNSENEQQQLTFVSLKEDADEIPIVIVNCFVEGDVYTKATLVTYEAGKVKTQIICEGSMKKITADPNSNVLEVVDYHMGEQTFNYYKVENKSNSLIEWISETMDENDKPIVYHTGTVDKSNEISEEKFNSIKNKYSSYNLLAIDTELTDINVDKFID